MLKAYELHWNDNTPKEIVIGQNIAEAFKNNGYSNAHVQLLDFYREVEMEIVVAEYMTFQKEERFAIIRVTDLEILEPGYYTPEEAEYEIKLYK